LRQIKRLYHAPGTSSDSMTGRRISHLVACSQRWNCESPAFVGLSAVSVRSRLARRP